MYVKGIVLSMLILAYIGMYNVSAYWQNAELVDEIRHTEDALWVHDGPSKVNNDNNNYYNSLIETKSSSTQQKDPTIDKNMIENLKNEIRSELKKEFQKEIDLRNEREKAEISLIESIAKRVATWTPSFKFNAEKSNLLQLDDAITPLSTASLTAQPLSLNAATKAEAISALPAAPAADVAPAQPTEEELAKKRAEEEEAKKREEEEKRRQEEEARKREEEAKNAVDPECQFVKCHNNGICQKGKCICSGDFSGDFCQNKINCTPRNCINGACENDACKCRLGWSGPTCEVKETDPCRLVSCVNGGECQKDTGACKCWGNFSGKSCEIPPPLGQECVNVRCLNGGVCKSPGFCTCPDGFQGKACETNICDTMSCLNGGKCQNGKCQCINNFTGPKCEIDPCSTVKCMNKGTCLHGECLCKAPFRGPTCTIDMRIPADPNTPIPMLPGYDLCSCPGTSNVMCSTLVNNTCNAGTAIGSNATVISIPPSVSFAGVNIDYPCHTLPCRNNGKCLKGKCKCPVGYHGLICEIEKCSQMKCENNGICKDGKCYCQAGFSGKLCQVNLCNNIQCLNDGVCHLGKCQCHVDYKGKYCELLSRTGKRRRKLHKKLTKLVNKVDFINGTALPPIMNMTKKEFFLDNAINATEVSLERADLKHLIANDLAYNMNFRKGPKVLRDRNGNMINHIALSGEEIEQAVNNVEMPPTVDLATDHASLSNAHKLNVEAMADHLEVPKTIYKLEKMALIEQDSELNDNEELEDEMDDELDDEVDDQEE